MPIGRTDLIPEDYEIVDKRNDIPVEPLDFKFTLRDSQQSVYDEVEGSCIINAWVSWGKTFTALAIANKLQQKTLIVTHTLALRSQWEKEVQKVFGVTGGCDRLGTIRDRFPLCRWKCTNFVPKYRQNRKRVRYNHS